MKLDNGCLGAEGIFLSDLDFSTPWTSVQDLSLHFCSKEIRILVQNDSQLQAVGLGFLSHITSAQCY